MTAPSRYHYQRGKDGCDDTWELYAPGKACPFACIHFWDEPDTNQAAETETLARRVVAALNVCEGVTAGELEQRAGAPNGVPGGPHPAPSRRPPAPARETGRGSEIPGPKRKKENSMVDVYSWVIDGDAPFDALDRILTYLWEDELRHYADGPDPGHVFHSLVAVANWLNSGAKWTSGDYVLAWENVPEHGWRAGGMFTLPWRDEDSGPPTDTTADINETDIRGSKRCPLRTRPVTGAR